MFGIASLLDGSLWANVRLGAFTAGTLGVLSLVLTWSRDEDEEVKKAREIVERADRKQRLARLAALLTGIAAVYGTIQMATYITTRRRLNEKEFQSGDVIQADMMYSD